jgi:hypothetical protein
MVMTLWNLLLANLKEEIPSQHREYMTKEAAYRELKRLSGQDFGYDITSWQLWIKDQHQSNKQK